MRLVDRWVAASLPLSLLACLLVVTTLLALRTQSAEFATSPHDAAFTELPWDRLVPEGWSPPRRAPQRGGTGLDDADPRAGTLLAQMQSIADAAPTVAALDGAAVRIAGYVVPLDEVRGELRSFLLVPYFGACIHTPPPPANQVVHVVLALPVRGFQTMDTVWVSGTLNARRHDSPLGRSGYRLDAIMVTRYVPPAR